MMARAMPRRASRQEILETLWPADMPSRIGVYAILDGARDSRIYGAVDASRQDKCCLYSGDLPWQLQMAAPYLVELDPGDPLLDYVINHGWGNAWGIFLRAETSMKNLRRHLRGFLRVQDESGRKLIFRYYDPRILRVYLPTCQPGELRTIFGPVDRYFLEDEHGGILEYGLEDGKLYPPLPRGRGSVGAC